MTDKIKILPSDLDKEIKARTSQMMNKANEIFKADAEVKMSMLKNYMEVGFTRDESLKIVLKMTNV